MKTLLFYFVKNLVRYGELEKCSYQLAGLDCWTIRFESFAIVLTRDDIILCLNIMSDFLPIMSDEEVSIYDRLRSLF